MGSGLGGGRLKIGLLTVTVKLQLARLPELSVAVQVTLVVPCENVDPEGGLQLTVVTVQLSLAVAEYVTTAVHCPGTLWTMFGGQTIDGRSSSFTVTLKLQVVVLFPSVALQITVVVPTLKTVPEAGVQLT